MMGLGTILYQKEETTTTARKSAGQHTLLQNVYKIIYRIAVAAENSQHLICVAKSRMRQFFERKNSVTGLRFSALKFNFKKSYQDVVGDENFVTWMWWLMGSGALFYQDWLMTDDELLRWRIRWDHHWTRVTWFRVPHNIQRVEGLSRKVMYLLSDHDDALSHHRSVTASQIKHHLQW